MHRYELTGLYETCRIGVFNDGTRDGDTKIDKIGTWNENLEPFSLLFCIRINDETLVKNVFKLANLNKCEESAILTDFSAPGSYFADFNVTIASPVIENLHLENFANICEFVSALPL